MPKEIEDRRTYNRKKVPWKTGAMVEIEVPGGSRQRFALLDFSVGNVCFEVPAGITGIEAGVDLGDSRVIVGKLEIECHLSVVRTWRQFNGSCHYGARLFPKTEEDQNELITLVAAMEKFETANATE